MGGLRPPNLPASMGEAKAPRAPWAQARIARTATEHETIMVRNMMSNHTCSDRPLPTCKTRIVVIAIIFTLFTANAEDTTKEVVRPKAAPPLLWWRPKAATFVYWL